MIRNKLIFMLALLTITSLVLAACQPQQVVTTVVVTEEVMVEGTPQVVERVVTPTAAPTAAVEKTMVVCMAQEPTTLNLFDTAALVKSAVLEAVTEPLMDSRSYDYQAVGVTKVPNFDDGDAVLNEVEVGVGDSVYDAALDEMVTIAPTSTVTLNQKEGGTVEHDFAVTPTAKTVELSVTWTLVDGMTWEDGTPVTTDDMVYAWEVWKDPDTTSPSKYLPDRSLDLVAVDDKSFTWTGAPGFTSGTYFFDIPGTINPYPRHAYGSMTVAEQRQDETVNRHPLAYSAFKVDEWVSGDHITLSKNPTYWRAGEGLPKLDKLIYRFVPDTNQLIAQLASGECDLGTQDAAFEGSLPLIRQFEAQNLLIPQVVAGTVFEHLDFDTKPVDSYTGFANRVKNDDGSPIFANLEIRQAIAYCIDKQAIVDQTTNGAAVVQHVYVPADHPLYAGDDAITIYEFDPAKGLALLEKNGWTDSDGDGVLDKNGQKFSFVHSTRTNTNALRQKVTQVVQAQLKDNCKIETQIELYGGEYFADGPDGLVFGRQYDLGEFAWLTGVEPPCDLYQSNRIPSPEFGWGAQNNVGFQNADFDAACSVAITTLDENVKKEQHAKAQVIFSEQIPSIPLFARAKILVTRPEVSGVIMDPTANSEMWNVENFDITTP